jgi:mannose-6-phosphate isomerase-like protein (cupin superfamily)
MGQRDLQFNAYETKDGSWITELVRPERQGSRHLSVAEAMIEPGQSTQRHCHHVSEEVYYVLAGVGTVEVGAVIHPVEPDSVILIPPGVEHRATGLGEEPLRLLCLCSPPYTHGDTELTEPQTV